MGVLEAEDRKRFFVEKNIEIASRYFDEKTQLIYFDEEDPYDLEPKKASLLMNFGYVFALFRTKNHENILKAMSVLKRLLYFQIKAKKAGYGGFPKYIHQYPNAYDKRACVHIYVILYKLNKLFSKVLEKNLRKDLENALSRLKKFISMMDLNIGYEPDIEPLVSLILEKTLNKKPFVISSKHLETFVYMNVFSNEAAKPYLDENKYYWNSKLNVFVGPFFNEHFEKMHLRPTLFNLFINANFGTSPSQSLDNHYVYLLAALVLTASSEEKVSESISKTFLFHEMNACLLNDKRSSLFYFKNFRPKENDCYTNGFHVFSYLFGSSSENINSFVCQTKNMEISSLENEGVFSIDFTYPKIDIQEKKENSELNFYLFRNKDLQIFVDRKKATIFKLSEKLFIETLDRTLEISFSIVKGNGEVLGAISMGNRPSQMHSKAVSDYEAFDWKISLRTLRRDEGFTINMKMKVSLKQPLHEEMLLNLQEQDCLEKAP